MAAKADQLEYTAPTGFQFLGEPMFCFSILNANTNPNPNPEVKPAWAPTLAAELTANTVAKLAWALTLAANKSSNRNPAGAVYSN